MEKKKRRYFPDEFKRQAAERVETSGLSIMDVAAELGVHETQLDTRINLADFRQM